MRNTLSSSQLVHYTRLYKSLKAIASLCAHGKDYLTRLFTHMERIFYSVAILTWSFDPNHSMEPLFIVGYESEMNYLKCCRCA